MTERRQGGGEVGSGVMQTHAATGLMVPLIFVCITKSSIDFSYIFLRLRHTCAAVRSLGCFVASNFLILATSCSGMRMGCPCYMCRSMRVDAIFVTVCFVFVLFGLCPSNGPKTTLALSAVLGRAGLG